MEEERTSLIVTSLRPPFLSGNVQFTRQTEMVSTVKDPTNDFAVSAKKGSELLKSWLKDEEKKRSVKRDDFTSLSGSKMGQIIGVRQVKEKGDGKDMETDAEAK